MALARPVAGHKFIQVGAGKRVLLEREILVLIAQGYKNAEIASHLVISPKTVRNHITNILSKLQVADRAQAIIRAKEAGLA